MFIFQDTFARCRNCCRSHETEGKNYSTLSGRSSQVNSHSGNTDSACSRQSSLRYLEPEIAARRPLIVSFRRLNPPQDRNLSPYTIKKRGRIKFNASIDPDIQLDDLEELREPHNDRYLVDKLNGLPDIQSFSNLCSYDRSPNGSLDPNSCFSNGKCFSCAECSKSCNSGISMKPENLDINGMSNRKSKIRSNQSRRVFDVSPDTSLTDTEFSQRVLNCTEYVEDINESKGLANSFFVNSFMSDSYEQTALEMQNLQPTHICPHKARNRYLKIEDIEIFHKQTLKINKKNDTKSRKHRHHHHHNRKVAETSRPLQKSCTFTNGCVDRMCKPDQCNGNGDDKTLSVPAIPAERRNSFSCLRIDSAAKDASSAILLVQ